MKYTCEVSQAVKEDEIIIRCREKTDKIRLLENMIESIASGDVELTLYIGDIEYFVPCSDILYFETENGRIKAHTADKIFTTRYRLFELEQILPRVFLRISKSCILNTLKIDGIRHSPLSASEVYLKNSDKKVYISRAYFKITKEKLKELRG